MRAAVQIGVRGGEWRLPTRYVGELAVGVPALVLLVVFSRTCQHLHDAELAVVAIEFARLTGRCVSVSGNTGLGQKHRPGEQGSVRDQLRLHSVFSSLQRPRVLPTSNGRATDSVVLG